MTLNILWNTNWSSNLKSIYHSKFQNIEGNATFYIKIYVFIKRGKGKIIKADKNLINALSKRDRSAQKQLFLQFHSFVMGIALRYTRDRQEAEELTNDVFLKVFDKIDSYNPTYPLGSWIKTITVNKCIDQYRKRSKGPTLIALDPEYEQEYDPFWDDEDFEKIEQALRCIPEKYRVIFNLYVFEDYSHKEIAKLLKIAVGTSKSAVSRAKKIIKAHYINRKKVNESRKETVGQTQSRL